MKNSTDCERKSLETECENLKAELKNVRIELEDKKEIARMRLDLFNKASTERNELHKKLEEQLATAKEEVKKWQNECENLKAELKNVCVELEDKKEIARMRLDLFNKASTERNELHKKLEEQRDKEQEVYDDSENVALKSINNALQTQVATAKEEVKKWQNECLCIKVVLRNVRAELEDIKATSSTRLNMINDYMREKKKLYQKLEKLEGEINQSLSERYKQLRVENKKLKECLKRFVSYSNQAKELAE